MAGGLPGQPRTDGAGAVADQAGQVVGAPALGRFDHEGSLQPQTLAQQVVVHRPDSQQGRDGGEQGTDASARSIGNHQNLVPPAHGRLGFKGEAIQGCFQARRPVGNRQQGGEGGHAQPLMAQGDNIRFIEHRGRQAQHRGSSRIGPKG